MPVLGLSRLPGGALPILWSGSRNVPMAWGVPIMEKWLAEASFLLRLLMAPSSHPKGSGKHLPSSELPLLAEAVVI